MAEEEARRRELTPAMAVFTGPPSAKEVVLDLYSIGGRPALDALSWAIGESPMGRAYLSIHIQAIERGERAGLAPWRDRLRHWLTRESQTGLTTIPVHSGSMTTIRFMLAEEGFAQVVNGGVTIEPSLSNALRLALGVASAAS